MPKVHGAKILKDGSIIVHPDAEMTVDVGKDSIKVPQIDTSYGAGFGDSLGDNDRAFAATREPVGHFLTYIVARDMVDKWFMVNDPDTEEADPELDRSVQRALKNIKFKRRLREALEISRTFGKALLVGGFSDAKDVNALQFPLTKEAELLQLAVYPGISSGGQGYPSKVKAWEVYKKEENKNSGRYGEPVVYKLHRRENDYIYVHYTRVCEVGDGTSVLDKVWDDMTCGRNIRWGAAQWMYRTGSGFACIGFPEGTSAEQLETYHDSGAFRDLHARTALFYTQNSQQANDGMVIDFKGVAGHALDPVPFFKSNIEQIAIATGYPQAKLIGAQAGAVTGSEVNQQEYYKAISRDQEEIEDVVRWVIDHLATSKQISLITATVDKNSDNYALRLFKSLAKRLKRRDYRHKTAENYVIEWNSAFELSELDESQVRLNNASAIEKELKYKTVDEVRAEDNLDPLPNGEGAHLKQEGFNLFNEEGKQPNGEQVQTGDESFIVTPVRRKHEHEHSDSSGSSDTSNN